MNEQLPQFTRPSRNEIRMILDLALGACTSPIGSNVVQNAMIYFERVWQKEDELRANPPTPPFPTSTPGDQASDLSPMEEGLPSYSSTQSNGQRG